jgi:hypothetical protein
MGEAHENRMTISLPTQSDREMTPKSPPNGATTQALGGDCINRDRSAGSEADRQSVHSFPGWVCSA